MGSLVRTLDRRFSSLKNLRKLIINSAVLADSEFVAFAKKLLPHVTSCTVDERIPSDLLSQISVLSLESLTIIPWRKEHWNPPQWVSMYSILKEKLPKLRKLRFGGVFVDFDSAFAAFASLQGANLPNLESFSTYLPSINLTPLTKTSVIPPLAEAFDIVCKLMRRSPTRKHLDLYYPRSNDFGPEDSPETWRNITSFCESQIGLKIHQISIHGTQSMWHHIPRAVRGAIDLGKLYNLCFRSEFGLSWALGPYSDDTGFIDHEQAQAYIAQVTPENYSSEVVGRLVDDLDSAVRYGEKSAIMAANETLSQLIDKLGVSLVFQHEVPLGFLRRQSAEWLASRSVASQLFQHMPGEWIERDFPPKLLARLLLDPQFCEIANSDSDDGKHIRRVVSEAVRNSGMRRQKSFDELMKLALLIREPLVFYAGALRRTTEFVLESPQRAALFGQVCQDAASAFADELAAERFVREPFVPSLRAMWESHAVRFNGAAYASPELSRGFGEYLWIHFVAPYCDRGLDESFVHQAIALCSEIPEAAIRKLCDPPARPRSEASLSQWLRCMETLLAALPQNHPQGPALLEAAKASRQK